MAERGLRRILAVGCILWFVHLLTEPARLAGAAPAPDALAFDSLVVTPPTFSPNADGQQDSVRISYRLRDSTHVTIRVTTLGGATTLRTLLADALQTTTSPPPVWWNGSAPGIGVVPDGDYEIRLSGITTTGSLLENQRQVRVDTRLPVAVIDSLEPSTYTPTVPGSRSQVRVRARVTGSDPGDSLQVQLHVNGDPERSLRIRLQQNTQVLQGDGFYWAVCDSCARSQSVGDGLHAFSATTRDAAGNGGTSAEVWLDKDIRGPRPVVRYPFPGSIAFVQHADSLVGTAYDRHGVGAVWMRIGGVVDSIALSGGVPPGDSIYVFRADLASLLAAEGRYQLQLRGQDALGVQDSSKYTVVVDRTAPGKPRLSPRPGPIAKSPELDVTLALVAADRVSHYRVLGAGDAIVKDWTRVSNPDSVQVIVLLQPGANALSFTTRDSTLNVSPPETLTVVWETSRGLACPERFRAGNQIQVHMGDAPGEGVELRILATDGSLIQRFEDSSSKLIYEFTWDLRTPEGRKVKNGAYLLFARLREAGGGEVRIRKLIAVLE